LVGRRVRCPGCEALVEIVAPAVPSSRGEPMKGPPGPQAKKPAGHGERPPSQSLQSGQGLDHAQHGP